jgi:hypothetical protein
MHITFHELSNRMTDLFSSLQNIITMRHVYENIWYAFIIFTWEEDESETFSKWINSKHKSHIMQMDSPSLQVWLL